MSYTVLRVTERGVVLYAEHERRFARAGDEALAAFRRFVADATAGIWALRFVDGELTASLRASSALGDDLPARFVVSPIVDRRGPQPKAPPPGPYDAVRLADVVTLLTSADGAEIFEGCRAAIVGWNGRSLVVPPEDRPRVASTAEAALVAAGAVRAPIAREGGMPIALVNAVRGAVRLRAEGHPPIPAEALAAIDGALEATIARR